MQITAAKQKKKRLQVAVGVLVKDECLLIQQRRNGTDCAGQWEFPGGKLEEGESPLRALERECEEELNIKIIEPKFLSLHHHNYAHAKVALHTYLIKKWRGEPSGREGQPLIWVKPDSARKYNLLAGAYPLLECAIAALDNSQ